MPKAKTNSGAAKRFLKRGKAGAYKIRRAFRNHILTKKSSKSKRQKRSDRSSQIVKKCDNDAVANMLGDR